MTIQQSNRAANDPRGAYAPARPSSGVNVSEAERAPSAALGGMLLMLGLGRWRSLSGVTLALAGGELLYRGITGHCHFYQALGISTANRRALSRGGLQAGAPEVERAITIGKSPKELYRLWREPRTLSQIMGHFAEITMAGENRQRWKAHTPLGQSIEWDARIVEDRPGEFLRWESLAGAKVPNHGCVRFRPAPGNRGTEVMLHSRFEPPGGAAGDWMAKQLGFVPRMLAAKALQRFKSLAETGEMPTLAHNPSARERMQAA
ncbi:MAG TPA: YgaP-like transmembrane domain [Acidobacteriaceae bacterium]|nr:YgaP-like transmembrane domain [Acidobacteriaceae bacterium]